MTTTSTYDIQQLIRESGTARRTVYFYVQQGILPPPEGAGLAAHYTEEHLLRLQLIPIMRRQGLRLEDIRQQFEQMNLEEMSHALSDAQAKQVAVRRAIKEASVPQETSARSPGAQQQVFIHYALPAGITLVVPADVAQAESHRLQSLLKAAGQILADLPGQHNINENGSSSSAVSEQEAQE